MLEVNTKAPDFRLMNQKNEEIQLSNYLGQKVVLYFYPKDNTPGCTTQACSFRDFNKDLKELGVVVLGVSKDSVKSHEKFAQSHNLNFDILADEDMDTMRNYQVLKENTLLQNTPLSVIRTTYIIDENGLIEKVYPKASSSENAREVYEYLKMELVNNAD